MVTAPCALQIRLGPGRSLTFRWLLLEDYSDGSNAGSGVTLVESGAEATEVVLDRSASVAPRCLPAGFLGIIMPTLTRVEYYPGTQNLSVLPGVPDVLRAAGTAGDGDGGQGSLGPCGVDGSAPPLQRCWAQVELYADFASWALKPGPQLSNIVNRMTQTVVLCVEVVTQSCLDKSGAVGCLMSGMKEYMEQRLNASSSGEGPEPQAPSPNGGTVSAGAEQKSGGLSRAQLAIVVSASTAGALALLAGAVAVSVWLHRANRSARQPKPADGGDPALEDPELCAEGGASDQRDPGLLVHDGPVPAPVPWTLLLLPCCCRGRGRGRDGGANGGVSTGGVSTSGKPKVTGKAADGLFEESSLDSTDVAGGGPEAAAAAEGYRLGHIDAPVVPMSPCQAPLVSIVDERTCQPPGQPPPPATPEADASGAAGPGAVVADELRQQQPEEGQGEAREEEVMLLRRVLGMGAFGKVYEGLYRGERVAVKVLTGLLGPGLPSQLCLEDAVKSLEREVEVLGRVSHPNVVRLLAACVTPPRMGLVLELMETSLSRLMYNTRPPHAPLLPVDEVLTIATHVAAGLAYLHPTIVHRDLKPANVLISGYGTPQLVAKLADFGLSRFRLTALATLNPEAGTAAYLAPECFDVRNHVVTHAADMYSFGVLLWEILVGREPWQGLAPMTVAVKVQLHRERLSLDAVAWARGWAEVPPKLLRLLQQCFDQEPRRRPAAAETVKQLLLAREELASSAAEGRKPSRLGLPSWLKPRAQAGPALQALCQAQAQPALLPCPRLPQEPPAPAAVFDASRPHRCEVVDISRDTDLMALHREKSSETEDRNVPIEAVTRTGTEGAEPTSPEAVGERCYAPALALDRNVTIRGPSASPLHRLSLGFLRGWIRMSPGRSLTFRWLLLEDYSDGSNTGSGVTLVEPGGGVTEVVIDRCPYIAPRCFSAAFLSSAPPLQRCWAQVLAYNDFASWALNPGLLLSNIVNRQTQAVALCVKIVTQACLETYGPTECLMFGFKAYMAQRLNASGSGDGIGTSPEPQAPGSIGGTLSAASDGSEAEGLSRAQLAAVVAASTVGALVLLAVAVVGSVWLHRNWSAAPQPKAADEAAAVLPMSPCHAPFVSIVDERTCQPPTPPEPASPGEGLIAGDVTPAGSVVSARADERQPGEDEVMLLRRVLGMGAFGKVYEGLYRGERVAVKVLTGLMGPGLPSHLCPDAAVQSLEREVEVLGRVSHPNVVLELMETSLSRLMYNTRPPHAPLLPIDEVLTIATHVAAGLAYLHPTIVHRDLKPANVLISGYGTPQLVAKLADFGLSRLRSTTVATENPEAGTAAYLAPECYDVRNSTITHDADMYSFGVLLWEMLMGREPWQVGKRWLRSGVRLRLPYLGTPRL
ncbi:hypothetical protein HYH03_007972 [Edaphochlamys debaryana]|uniref:Protein kinase domain-containing protein n=1 Tax=Edaphochlamys debaryana TaxID=47281 RepID=A0A836BYN5_9CHLO|nr:hypothetical protein HYH03_007972 [Edaphochlamys debaryana]|eukprot:KAG2493750.1 hypothetical protein HYH03_007972 [Edaphochlamys debaryana]